MLLNWFPHFRTFRRILILLPLTSTSLVAVIYIIGTLWQRFKKKKSTLPIVLPHVMALNINNAAQNPNVMKSKVFITILSYWLVICIFVAVDFYVRTTYNDFSHIYFNILQQIRLIELLAHPLVVSLIFPLCTYIANPSLRQYLRNYFRNWFVL